MTDQKGRLRVALLTLPEITASTLYGMHDLFASAGRDWGFLVNGVPGEPRIQPLIVAANAAGRLVANDVWVKPHTDLDGCPTPDVICVPELFVAPDDDLAGRFETEIEWLQRCYRQGATLASACSGAVLLARAGLLDGQDATAHWGYCDALAVRYPTIRMHPDRALVVSGDEQRIVMAGGGTSWQDLALFLVGRFLGIDEAMRLAKIYLIDWHDMGQQPYAVLTRARQIDDAVIGDCQTWIAGHYEQEAPSPRLDRSPRLLRPTFLSFNLQPRRAPAHRFVYHFNVCGVFQTSPSPSKLVATLRQNGFVILKTDSSSPVTPHPASRRRSYLRLPGRGTPGHRLSPC